MNKIENKKSNKKSTKPKSYSLKRSIKSINIFGLTTESRDRTQIIYIKNKSESSLQIPWKLK